MFQFLDGFVHDKKIGLHLNTSHIEYRVLQNMIINLKSDFHNNDGKPYERHIPWTRFQNASSDKRCGFILQNASIYKSRCHAMFKMCDVRKIKKYQALNIRQILLAIFPPFQSIPMNVKKRKLLIHQYAMKELNLIPMQLEHTEVNHERKIAIWLFQRIKIHFLILQ